jgi:hypothetical protein
MRNLSKSIALIGLMFGTISMANAQTTLVSADDYVTSNICVAATAGSKIKLHKAIKEAGLTKRLVVEKVKCNQMPIVEFVAQYGDKVTAINDYMTDGQYSKNMTFARLNPL